MSATEILSSVTDTVQNLLGAATGVLGGLGNLGGGNTCDSNQ